MHEIRKSVKYYLFFGLGLACIWRGVEAAADLFAGDESVFLSLPFTVVLPATLLAILLVVSGTRA